MCPPEPRGDMGQLQPALLSLLVNTYRGSMFSTHLRQLHPTQSLLPKPCQLLGSRGGGGGGCRCFNAIISPESVIFHLQHSFYSLCASLLALKSLVSPCLPLLLPLLPSHPSPESSSCMALAQTPLGGACRGQRGWVLGWLSFPGRDKGVFLAQSSGCAAHRSYMQV